MKIRAIVSILIGASLSANAYDQPEVKFLVELRSGERIVECPVMVGSLGDSLEVVLGNTMRVAARATPMDRDGHSAINLKIYSVSGAMARQFNYSAKLAQQKPSFQYTIPEPRGGLTIVVESPSLLASTPNRSWKEFETRMKPNNTFERTNSQQGCAPLLGAAQLGR